MNILAWRIGKVSWKIALDPFCNFFFNDSTLTRFSSSECEANANPPALPTGEQVSTQKKNHGSELLNSSLWDSSHF